MANKTVYLPIRAFGDFIIAAAAAKDRFSEKIPVILPAYFTEIYNAINADQYFEIVGSTDYSNQPAFYELYKVKDVKNIKRLINDLGKIYNLMAADTTYLLDYSSKRLRFTRGKATWPNVNENLYSGKYKMFSEHFETKKSLLEEPFTFPLPDSRISKILIIPGSRIETKRISDNLVSDIKKSLDSKVVNVAEFSSQNTSHSKITYFSNFVQLIDLINAYDFVISAESLPYHLAQYLKKPHFVIYNNSRHSKNTFMTPFMIKNNYYAHYNSNNNVEIISKLEKILR